MANENLFRKRADRFQEIEQIWLELKRTVANLEDKLQLSENFDAGEPSEATLGLKADLGFCKTKQQLLDVSRRELQNDVTLIREPSRPCNHIGGACNP